MPAVLTLSQLLRDARTPSALITRQSLCQMPYGINAPRVSRLSNAKRHFRLPSKRESDDCARYPHAATPGSTSQVTINNDIGVCRVSFYSPRATQNLSVIDEENSEFGSTTASEQPIPLARQTSASFGHMPNRRTSTFVEPFSSLQNISRQSAYATSGRDTALRNARNPSRMTTITNHDEFSSNSDGSNQFKFPPLPEAS